MDNEFQEVLEKIRKGSSKYKDIQDIKDKIIDNLVEAYKGDMSLLKVHLEKGRFDIGELNMQQIPLVVVSDFVGRCNSLNIYELYEIFTTLYEKNKGYIVLKEVRDELRKTKESPEPEEDKNLITTQSPGNSSQKKTRDKPAETQNSPGRRENEHLVTTQKILFLSANPKGSSPLRLDEEMREIKEGLLRSKKREKFVIETRQAVRYREIRRAILDFEPNIVHFSGHGAGEEGLAFEDETGQEKLVKAEALAGLFKLFANQIECVVLNACYSEIQAKAIAQHIPSVVGMKKEIGDRAAIEFAVGFYDGLGAGRTVDFAYELGCNSIEIAGIPESLIPQLLRKNSEDIFPIPGNSTTHLQKRSSSTDTIPQHSADTDKTLDPIYKNLENYLANKQWKEADLETMRLMIEISDSIESSNHFPKNRDLITWLNREEIKKIPYEALKTIDKLWLKYSNGNFGFSVQAKIWSECKGKPGEFYFPTYQNKFAKSIGWYDGKNWIKRYDDFDFSSEAKPGHLPSLSFPNQKNYDIKWSLWKETFEALLPRLF